MQKTIVLLFAVISIVYGSEEKSFFSKFFTKKYSASVSSNIDWQEEYKLFSEQIKTIDTIFDEYRTKINTDKLTSIEAATLDSMLNYLDTGNQSFLKPRESSKYAIIKQKTKQMRKALYEFIYFNPNSTRQRLTRKVTVTMVFLADFKELKKEFLKIKSADKNVFQSISGSLIQKYQEIDNKTASAKKESEAYLATMLEQGKYDEKSIALEKRIDSLKTTLEKESLTEESLTEEKNTEAELETKITTRNALKNNLKTVTENLSKIDLVHQLIDDAITLNLKIVKERASYFFSDHQKLKNKKDALTQSFYGTFIKETFPNQSTLINNIIAYEEKEKQEVRLFDEKKLQEFKKIVIQKNSSMKLEQERLSLEINTLLKDITELKKRLQEKLKKEKEVKVILITQTKNNIEKAKKELEDIKKQKDNIIQINTENLNRKIESLTQQKEAILLTDRDILDHATAFFMLIQKIAGLIAQLCNPLQNIIMENNNLECLPTIQWCYQPANIIPIYERPKRSVFNEIKHWWKRRRQSNSLEPVTNDFCYFDIQKNKILEFRTYYKEEYTALKQLIDQIDIIIEQNKYLDTSHLNNTLLQYVNTIISSLTNDFNLFHENALPKDLKKEFYTLDFQEGFFEKLQNEIDTKIMAESKQFKEIIYDVDQRILEQAMLNIISFINQQVETSEISPVQEIKGIENTLEERINIFLKEYQKIELCISMIKLFKNFQFDSYNQNVNVMERYTLLLNNVAHKITIINEKLGNGIIQSFTAIKNKVTATTWNKKIVLYNEGLYNAYRFLNIQNAFIIPLLKDNLFTNNTKPIKNSIKTIIETMKEAAQDLLNGMRNNVMGTIFKPKYGALLKSLKKLNVDPQEAVK